MGKVIYNGEFFSEKEVPIDFRNRAFLYGDGMFETIRVINGRPVFLNSHIQRVVGGLNVLKIEIPESFSTEVIDDLITRLTAENGIEKGGSVRFTIWRDSIGRFRPESDKAAFLLAVSPYPENLFTLNKTGLSVAIYQEMKKQVNRLSRFKHLNSQINVLAAIYARERELDDSLLINDDGMIIESSNSNIFIVSNGTLYTPPLSDGCVGGTMRMHLINAALDLNIGTYESSLNQQHLLMADEVLLTNAIRGIQWVNAFKHKRFFSKLAEKLVDKINEVALRDISSTSDQQEN